MPEGCPWCEVSIGLGHALDCPVELGTFPVGPDVISCEACGCEMFEGEMFVDYRGRVHPSRTEVLCLGCGARAACGLDHT